MSNSHRMTAGNGGYWGLHNSKSEHMQAVRVAQAATMEHLYGPESEMKHRNAHLSQLKVRAHGAMCVSVLLFGMPALVLVTSCAEGDVKPSIDVIVIFIWCPVCSKLASTV